MLRWLAVLVWFAPLTLCAQQPLAIMPGKSTEVRVPWSEPIVDVWTSFPAQTEILGKGVVRFTLNEAATVGIGGFRVASSNGISPMYLLLIDDLATINEGGSNQTVSTGQTISLPIAIDAACNEVAFDYYRFAARKGQILSIETVAQRLGSRADTVLRLLDEHGRELLFADDGAAGRDSRCVFQAPRSGQYLLEVRDMNYGGGGDYRYRLRIGDFPLVTAIFPPAVAPGAKTSIKWLGTDLRPVEASVGPVSVRHKGQSGFGTVLEGDENETQEAEPNDEKANRVSSGWAVSGRFDRNNDRDLFQFSAGRDERISFRVQTRDLNSPCDAMVRILKLDGSKLVEMNVDVGALTNTFKEAGDYFMEVRELTGRGGSDFVYRVQIQRLTPGFSVSTESDRFDSKEGALTLKVSCPRRDYSGAISLSVSDAKGWFVMEDNVLGTNKTETVLKLKPTENCPRGKILPLQISGTATIAEKPVSEPLKRATPLVHADRMIFAIVP